MIFFSPFQQEDNAGVRSKLFQVMVQRIPRLIVPVDHSVWAMQELADTNIKCMKIAALGYPEPPFSLIIRAPVPWHQQYLIAREFATHNLFATHPVSLELRKLWNSKYVYYFYLQNSDDQPSFLLQISVKSIV